MIRNMLDLSTAHVPGPNPIFGNQRVAIHEYGWTVYPNYGVLKDAPEWLKPILNEARGIDVAIINFDSSAPEYPKFKQFSW